MRPSTGRACHLWLVACGLRQAALRYDQAALKYHKQRAITNFVGPDGAYNTQVCARMLEL